MQNKKFIFISGLHRSGTSLLYKILDNQDNISALRNTKQIEDEGQFIQSVYKPGYKYGGVGRFGFNEDAELNEKSKLITDKNREKIYNEWAKYWDTNKEFLVEKSPPNIIRTRFLQAMFSNSYFINITRHPIATSFATKKWSKTSLDSLIDHWIICHKKYNDDRKYLKRSIDIKYEDLILKTEKTLSLISNFLGSKVINDNIKIKEGINQKYLNMWEKKKSSLLTKRKIRKIIAKYESDIKKYGYSLIEY